MAKQPTEAPRTRPVTVNGVVVEIPEVFSEGHVCTAAEAKTLDQVRRENIRNNTAKIVKDGLGETPVDKADAKVVDELKAKIVAYAKDYAFSEASVGAGRTRDPLQTEIRRLAREFVHTRIREKGRKVKDMDAEKVAAAIDKVSQDAKVIEQAKANLAQKQKIADTALEELDLD